MTKRFFFPPLDMYRYTPPQYYLTFNGSSTRINAGSDASLDDIHDDAMTVEAWVKADSAGEGNLGRIFATGTGWALYVDVSNRLVGEIACATANAYAYSSNNSVVDGAWHHVAMTWDDATMDHPRLWIDGAEDTDSHSDRTGAVTSDAAQAKNIGNNASASGTFDGDIAWVRWSNSIRYTGSFTPRSRINPPAVDGNTIEQWNLNDASGATAAAEVSSPTNDGTISDGSWGQF